jgi:hypothetical protein
MVQHADQEQPLGGSGDKRPDVWMTEFASLLKGNGMGYGRSGNAGVSAGYDPTVGFLNGEVLCPLLHCMGI